MIGVNFMTSAVPVVSSAWYDERLADGGPHYAEYHPHLLIVEPWNALSSVVMMLPAVLWFVRLWPAILQQRFLLFALLMVFLGGLGSTLFHAFRATPVFLFLDFVPPAILSLSLSVFFWLKIFPRWWQVLLLFVPFIVVRFLFFQQLPPHMGINVSYAFSGMMVIVPLFLFLYRNHFQFASDVVMTIVLFSISLLFRQLDTVSQDVIPQGTHFLWHLFSAGGSWFLIRYLFRIHHTAPLAG